MRTSNIEIDVGNNQFKSKILIDLNTLPSPTAVYLALPHEVFLNKYALKALGMRDNELFDLKRWLKINPHLMDVLKKLSSDVMINQKALVTLFSGKKEIIHFNVGLVRNQALGNIFFIHFSKATEKYSMSSIAALHSIKDEIAKLKPYLNHTGKCMLEKVMKKYFFEEDQRLTLDDLVYYEKELRLIQKTYPLLSQREVILCGLLVNNISSQDIATITNRTLDSVFVTIHRINKKLNLISVCL